MRTMYPAQVNSPGTELAAAIDAAQDTFLVADGSVLPDGPNLLTIGTDEAAETILYTGKTGDALTGITRGFQGTAQSWVAGTKVARYFTAYDHDAAISNISELSTGLTATSDRLDIEERQDVVLNAGMQILNAQRRAAFSLSGIKGRTLVNLLGRTGGMESLSGIASYQATIALDTTIKDQGISSLKVTLTASQGSGVIPIAYKAGKYYVAIGRVKNGNATYGYIAIPGAVQGTFITDTTAFRTSWLRYAPVADGINNIDSVVVGASGQYSHFDAVRYYEISKAEYDQLATMTPEQVAAKYPYVDSVQPVRNPYAIRYGENLLPPFYEWKVRANKAIINGPYSVSVTVDNAEAASASGLIPAVEGVDYTLSITRVGAVEIGLSFHDKDGVELQTSGYVNTSSLTVKSPTKTVFVQTHINVPSTSGDYQFNNFMLTLGSTLKPFKPREESMLALQTDLFADPLTGTNADEIFEKDGQYFKLAKWKKVDLDGTFTFSNGSSGFTGLKRVQTSLPTIGRGGTENPHYGIKYDGKILTTASAVNSVDQVYINSNGQSLTFAIANTDSGWGDNYTPTADEIKAYFMGWKMFVWGSPVPNSYNGTGTKGWAYRQDGTADGYAGGSTTLPTMQAPNWTPYQLVYQLATPTVEPIVSEGMLTFNEGDNQIEVGTGIVVRESVKPQPFGGAHVINDINLPGSILNHKVEKFLNVYKNGYRDQWEYRNNSAYGNERRVKYDGYDPAAAYFVTYLMLDKSPVVPFSGSYAANEKAMLQELTDAVQQNATAVSVLMNKKADKDAPAVWITPTLLNGWVNMGSGTSAVAYTKDASGFVHLKGRIKSGTIGWNPVFVLPEGYRSKEVQTFLVRGYTTKAELVSLAVNTIGHVMIIDGTNNEIAIDGITFLAEQ